MTTSDISIGDRLKSLRLTRKQTQEQFGSSLCYGFKAISNRERGHVKITSDDCRRLLKAFPDLNLNWLITGEGEIYANH